MKYRQALFLLDQVSTIRKDTARLKKKTVSNRQIVSELLIGGYIEPWFMVFLLHFRALLVQIPGQCTADIASFESCTKQ